MSANQQAAADAGRSCRVRRCAPTEQLVLFFLIVVKFPILYDFDLPYRGNDDDHGQRLRTAADITHIVPRPLTKRNTAESRLRLNPFQKENPASANTACHVRRPLFFFLLYYYYYFGKLVSADHDVLRQLHGPTGGQDVRRSPITWKQDG